MLRTAGRACVALVAFLSVIGIAAAPAQASPTVTCSSYYWSYFRSFSNPPVYSPPITCTASNGVAPYSYSWQRTGGNSATHAVDPLSNTTGFRRGGVGNGGVFVSTFRLNVVDATGALVQSAPVTVEFEWENGQ